jgi:hypothetical protein
MFGKAKLIARLEMNLAVAETRNDALEANALALKDEVHRLKTQAESDRNYWMNEFRKSMTMIPPVEGAITMEHLAEEAEDEDIEQPDNAEFQKDWDYWHGDSIKITGPTPSEES